MLALQLFDWISKENKKEPSNNPLIQELIQNIARETGLSDDKATKVVQTVSDFIKEKYPLLSGTVDTVLENDQETNIDKIYWIFWFINPA